MKRQEKRAGHGHTEDGGDHHEDGDPGEQGVGHHAGPHTPDDVDHDEDTGHRHDDDHKQLEPHRLTGQGQILEKIFFIGGNFFISKPDNITDPKLNSSLDKFLPLFNSRTNPSHEGGAIDQPAQVKSQHDQS